MRKPFASETFVIFVAMFGMLVVDGPLLYAVGHGYQGQWYPLIMLAGAVGTFGAIGTLGWFITDAFEWAIELAEKHLSKKGYSIHWLWGMIAGITIIIAAVMLGSYTLIVLAQTENVPKWMLVVALIDAEAIACCGLALLRLHNRMAKNDGQSIFIL